MLKEACKPLRVLGDDVRLHLDDADKQAFKERFTSLYFEAQQKMLYKDHTLDRHKVSAIAIISVIEQEIVDARKLGPNIALERVALDTGLSFMLVWLNDELKERELPTLRQYSMPEPFYCDTPYISSFARSLYYTRINGKSFTTTSSGGLRVAL